MDEVIEYLAMVVGHPESPVCMGGGNELVGVVTLTTMDVEELRCRLEVWTCQAGIRMGTVLLRRSSAIAIGKARLNASEIVLGPLGVGSWPGRIEGDALAQNGDPVVPVRIEGASDGRVVEGGIAGSHLRAGMSKNSLDHMLGNALVDQASPQGVAEAMGAEPERTSGLVTQVDVDLPAGEP